MDSPEFIELTKKFLFGLLIAVIIVCFGIILFSKKFGDMRSNALEEINRNETFLLFVTDSKNCDSCDNISEKLDSYGLSYIEYNIYRARDFEDICFKLGISKSNFKAPSLIYIKDGNKIGSILDISNDEQLSGFLKSYNFIS